MSCGKCCMVLIRPLIREGWGTVSSAVVGLRAAERWQRNGVKWAFEI